MPDAPSLPPIELESSRLRCVIDHQRGASILGLWARPRAADPWLPIIGRGYPGEDPRAKPPCFIMAPWTNRIASGHFSFAGRSHQLRTADDDGTARHGDVRSRPFAIIDRSPLSARLAFDSRQHKDVNFPFAFACEVRYELLDAPDSSASPADDAPSASLRVDLAVISLDDQPFPAGCGLHPYFPRSPGPRTPRPRVIVDADGRYPMVRSIPIGPARADALVRRFRAPAYLPAEPIDDLFNGFRGAAVLWPGLTLSIHASDNLSHMVMFAPKEPSGDDSPYLAIEPVTMANDGFNLFTQQGATPAAAASTGVAVLQPGQRLSTTTRFSIAFN